MELYLLRPIHINGDDPWEPWYDKCFGFVVRAENETQARVFADEDAGDENRGEFLGKEIANTTHPWLSPKYSTCEILVNDGEAGVVIKDFSAA